MAIPQLLRHLGLWGYRQEIHSVRRSNIVRLYLNEEQSESIVFVAQEEPTANSGGEIVNVESEWDSDIKYLNIWRVIFRGIKTDLK